MNPEFPRPNLQPSVRLHIERLVVDEALVAGGQGGTLQAAIETELARLLAAGGLAPLADTNLASLTASKIHVAQQTRPAQLGSQIAQAIHTTIGATNPPASSAHPNGGTR
jgi:hypothetical protein